MKNPTTPEIENYRIAGPYGEPYGQFVIKLGTFRLFCQVSAGLGWDHVSVSLPNRCPTWAEMDTIKRLFWNDDEIVMQLHVHGSKKVNLHSYCLHLWRPQTAEEMEREKQAHLREGNVNDADWILPNPIPLPPLILV